MLTKWTNWEHVASLLADVADVNILHAEKDLSAREKWLQLSGENAQLEEP